MSESTVRLPTVFISHGSPMHALEAGAAGTAWAAGARYRAERFLEHVEGGVLAMDAYVFGAS